MDSPRTVTRDHVEAQATLDAHQGPAPAIRTRRGHQPVQPERDDADQQRRHGAEGGRGAEEVHECHAHQIEPDIRRGQQSDPYEWRWVAKPGAVHQHVAREVVGRVVIGEIPQRPHHGHGAPGESR